MVENNPHCRIWLTFSRRP